LINRTDPLGLLDPGDFEAVRQAAAQAARSGAETGVGVVGAGAVAVVGAKFALVAGAGLAAGYAIGYYPGQWSARYFYPDQFPDTQTQPSPQASPSATQGPKQKPKCEPIQLKPFEWTPPLEFPFPSSGPLGPQNPPRDRERRDRCREKCLPLLDSGDLQSSEYRKCYRECIGTLLK